VPFFRNTPITSSANGAQNSSGVLLRQSRLQNSCMRLRESCCWSDLLVGSELVHWIWGLRLCVSQIALSNPRGPFLVLKAINIAIWATLA
jgi:hypothetical protein